MNKYLYDEKNDFAIMIKELIKLNKFTKLKYTKKKYERIITIITAMIEKYINIDNWFFEIYLKVFFLNNRNIFVKKNKTSMELEKIKHLLRKYKLSNIVKLFVNKKELILKQIPINNELLSDKYNELICKNLDGLIILFPFVIKDIKIPNKLKLCENRIEQLLHIFSYKQYCIINITLIKLH